MAITENPTEFGWLRAGISALITMAIWAVCWLVEALVVKSADLSWIDPSFPGFTFALACGIAWEYIRRDKARRNTKN